MAECGAIVTENGEFSGKNYDEFFKMPRFFDRFHDLLSRAAGQAYACLTLPWVLFTFSLYACA